MSTELVKEISSFVENQIVSFEIGLYQKLVETQPARLKLLADKHLPFITIFRDLHEMYYTNTCNSLVKSSDQFITTTFERLGKLSGHSSRCLLTILANLAVSVHFTIDRKQLNYSDKNYYTISIKKEIAKTISFVDIAKLFDHDCTGSQLLTYLSPGKKFIDIALSSIPVEKID